MVKSSQILGIFPTSSPWGSILVCLFCFSTYRCDMPWSGFMGYFPWSYPRPQMRFGKVASFSGSYGFVPMKWVPQLNDIRISLPEFRGRSPTLIWMLYVQWTVCLLPVPIERSRFICWYNAIISQDKSEREIWFPFVAPVAVSRIIFSFQYEKLVIQQLPVIRKDISNHWEFYDQSWTIDKSPTLCDAKVGKIDRWL